MNRQIFLLPGINPEPWAVGQVGTRQIQGKARPFIGPNPQMVTYKNAIAEEIKKQHPVLIDVPCEVTFLFWRRLDKYVTLSDKGHQRHIADATNMQKATEDALQGIVVTNDRLVQVVASHVVEQSVDTNPGLIITVRWPVVPIDSFDIDVQLSTDFTKMRAEAATSVFNLGNNI